MTDVDERLTLAFADLVAANRGRFRDGAGWGGPGYYDVRASACTADAAEVELVVAFRAGVRYCCFESGCHFPYYEAGWWAQLRECLDRHGLGHLPLPAIRSFRGVIERGAVAQPGIVGAPDTCFVWDGSEYQAGPWPPITRQAEPGAAPDPAM